MATALGSLLRPNGAPSDMFTTSIASAWVALYWPTQFRASTVRSVEPSQPKIFRATRLASGATPGPIANWFA